MTWQEAISAFKIGKVHQNATLDAVRLVNSGIAQEGLNWIISKNKPSLFLSGNPGSGKTFFMFSLLNGLTTQKHHKASILFVRSDDLDNELLRAVERRSEEYTLEKYQDVPFLFIDDLGVERVSDRIIKQYYNIIDRRMNNLLPTVFSSNISLEKISSTLGDRIASRLEVAVEIKFPKKDLRKAMSTLT